MIPILLFVTMKTKIAIYDVVTGKYIVSLTIVEGVCSVKCLECPIAL